MQRVLILCEYPSLLGGERSMLATLPAVTAAGFDVRVTAPADGPLAATLRKRGIPHVCWRTHDPCNDRPPLEQLRAELAALIERERPDLVHANSLSMARVSGPVVAQIGLPSIGHLRDIVRLSRQAVDDLNTHRRLIAVSQATRDFHVGQGLEAAKCVVVHNGVDLDEFRARPTTGYLHRELGLPPTARLVAVVGQLGLRKGTMMALNAVMLVAASVPQMHLLVVGERTSDKSESREYETALHLLAETKTQTGRVHFLGWRNDMPQLLGECTLLVHAARQEPLGRALLEAAASGLPVVATDVGGTREIFPTEEDGAVLFQPEDVLAMGHAIAELVRDDARREALGAAARRRAEHAFDLRDAAARLVEQYRQTIDS